MISSAAVDRAALRLADAWASGEQLTALPEDDRPATLADGYAVQDRLIDLLDEDVVGWKLGAGSARVQRETGAGRSIAGRIVRSRLCEAGAVIPLRATGPTTIEFEMAFVVSRTVRPGDAIADPAALIGEARLTCEWVRSRFVDRRAVGWPSFAADDAGFDTLVVGPRLEPSQLAGIMSTLVVDVDGVERVRAAQGDEVTDPLSAFGGFLALAAERGMTVPAGALISTGTMSVPFTITGPVAIEARCAAGSLAFRTSL
jgi:2-keto-4-pentenoate hydratase